MSTEGVKLHAVDALDGRCRPIDLTCSLLWGAIVSCIVLFVSTSDFGSDFATVRLFLGWSANNIYVLYVTLLVHHQLLSRMKSDPVYVSKIFSI
jgi:hypothetical protein